MIIIVESLSPISWFFKDSRLECPSPIPTHVCGASLQTSISFPNQRVCHLGSLISCALWYNITSSMIKECDTFYRALVHVHKECDTFYRGLVHVHKDCDTFYRGLVHVHIALFLNTNIFLEKCCCHFDIKSFYFLL